jgi:AcrR family transcriptional regulator
MKKAAPQKRPRKPRSDAEQNRERILQVAKQVFARRGAEASMGEIARRAKVGPGTLYRHFSSRDDLVASVYIGEVQKLAEAQGKLSCEMAPADALRAWLTVAIDYLAAKKLIAPVLDAMAGGPSEVFGRSSQLIRDALTALAAAAVESGDLRRDIDPMDLLRAIYGISVAGGEGDWPDRARTFVDILLLGSRPR